MRHPRTARCVSTRAGSLVNAVFLSGHVQGGSERGAFILLARRTNASIVFIAVTTNRNRGELRHQCCGGLGIDSACGTFIVGAPGCYQFTTSNTLTGRFNTIVPARRNSCWRAKRPILAATAVTPGFIPLQLRVRTAALRASCCAPMVPLLFIATDPNFGTKDGGGEHAGRRWDPPPWMLI